MNGGDFSMIVLVLQGYFSPSKHSSYSVFLQTFADWVINASAVK